MRVLIGCNRYFGDVAGGGNRVALDAAQYLVSQDHDVAFLCQGVPGKPESERLDGIRLLRYSVPPLDIDLFSRHQRAAKRTIRRALKAWTPDLLWGHMPLQMSAMMDSFPDARMTYTMHSPVLEENRVSDSQAGMHKAIGVAIKGNILSQIERRCCQGASTITVLSKFTKNEIHRLHGEKIAAKVRIAPGWADLSRFHPAASRAAQKERLGWPRDRAIFFSIRRLFARMGLDRLIDAAAMLRDRGIDFYLYIAGEGPLRADLESQIARLRLHGHVKMLGVLSEEQLAAMYSAADASVVPTRALECFGLIAVEAMSAGTPVLSTPVGALPEIIGAFEPHWLARDNSAPAIADLMANFIHKRLPVHSATEIRRYVEEHYGQSKGLPRFVRASLDQQTDEAPIEARLQNQ